MALQAQLVLNADQMNLPIYCGGQSIVGIGVTGTWVGTLNFEGSIDGINFIAVSATPFASGTAVSSATANGNWFLNVQNFLVVRVRFTRTSGSAVVVLAASVDGGYQDAFLATTTLYQTSSATGAVNTLTIAAQTNRAWRLLALKISLSAQPAWLTSPNLQIKDGTNVLWALDLPPSGSSGVIYDVALPPSRSGLATDPGGIVGTPGNAMSIVVANAQGSVKSIINAALQAA